MTKIYKDAKDQYVAATMIYATGPYGNQNNPTYYATKEPCVPTPGQYSDIPEELRFKMSELKEAFDKGAIIVMNDGEMVKPFMISTGGSNPFVGFPTTVTIESPREMDVAAITRLLCWPDED